MYGDIQIVLDDATRYRELPRYAIHRLGLYWINLPRQPNTKPTTRYNN
jgi:hypothetical protein